MFSADRHLVTFRHTRKGSTDMSIKTWFSVVRQKLGRASLVAVLGLGVAASAWVVAQSSDAHAKGPAPDAAMASIALQDMPKLGQDVHALILAGGPFPFDKDGTVFGNRERILPAAKRGYYREYTVARANARNRGAKRIVCGGEKPATPDACYYTEDHYSSFKRIIAKP
jgi:ribonuclease T1